MKTIIKKFPALYNFLARLRYKPTKLGQPIALDEWMDYYNSRKEIAAQVRETEAKTPKVSVIILTYNNLPFTQLCLKSVYCNTTYSNFEVIVVDNASSDETPDWLKSFANTHFNLKVILNTENRGFSGGNNQAAHVASGEFLIFLNNDVVVTEGWIKRLLAHMQSDSRVGLVGPVTNSTGNEARIVVNYKMPSEMESFASELARRMDKVSFDIRMLAFYCVMARKEEYENLGGLDERFGVGMFEDDDMAVRYHQAGLRVLCAEDVFVHHFQGMSFGKMENAQYANLFEENRRKYEEKWGRPWQPYQFREEVLKQIQGL